MVELYPWLMPQWQKLSNALQQGRLSHALLLSGPNGIGKQTFAARLSHLVLCEAEGAVICGQCKSCKLIASDSHPDSALISFEEKSKQIKVDQIRELNQFISKTAQQGRYKVAVIHPADQMNINAANALLKTLEEPSANSLLILVDDQLGSILPTIRSRCQTIDFPLPGKDGVMSWLSEINEGAYGDAQLSLAWQLAGGKPMVAKSILNDGKMDQCHQMLEQIGQLIKLKTTPVNVAEEWKSIGLDWILDWSLNWVQQLIRYKQTQDARHIQVPDAYQKMFVYLAEKAVNETLFRFYDSLLEYKDMIGRGLNPNESLLLENILISWQQIRNR